MAKVCDEITIPIKVGFTIDDATLRGCLTLIGMYAKENDICGMLIDFTSESGEPIILRSYTCVDDLKKAFKEDNHEQ